jgi:uncharacterized protein
MKIFLRELTDQETELDFTQDVKWVTEAVERVDEKIDGEPSRLAKELKSRPVQTHFSLRKVDEVAVVNGRIHTEIQLVCSRCAAYFSFPTDVRFSTLFCKDPAMAGVAHLERGENGEVATPIGRNQGFARHAHDSEKEKDLDITYISEEFISLGDVLTEQLTLQIPFQPLCREDCKGICSNCGADLNTGRCACAKLTKVSPFSVLKDFKL